MGAAPLDNAKFMEASWDWVQGVNENHVKAILKWGTIGDWDVSAVKTFKQAFSLDRNKVGEYQEGGNANANLFVGMAMSKYT